MNKDNGVPDLRGKSAKQAYCLACERVKQFRDAIELDDDVGVVNISLKSIMKENVRFDFDKYTVKCVLYAARKRRMIPTEHYRLIFEKGLEKLAEEEK